MTPPRARWRRVLRALLWTPLALLIFFEEWGWRPLSRAVGRLAQWPPLAALEARLRRVAPAVALALFLVPALLLLPVKLLALWAIHKGHAGVGLAVIVAAKLAGTALLGRLYVLVEPQLRSYPRVARALDAWGAYKDRIKGWLRASAVWRTARRWRAALRLRWRRLARRLVG